MKKNKSFEVISLMQGLPWGGSEELWYRTAIFALGQGFEVRIFIKKWPEEHFKVSHLRDLGVEIFQFKSESTSTPKGILSKVFKSRSKIDSPVEKTMVPGNSDVVLVSQGDTFSAFNSALFLQLLESDVPVYLLSQHLSDTGLPSIHLRRKGERYINKISKFCFVSQRSLELTKRYLNCSGENFHLVNNPVNLEEKKFVEFPLSTVPSFAVVARLDCRFKGQDILLEVLSQEKWKAREWNCNFYGKGIDEEYLRKLIHNYKLDNKVKLQGHRDSVMEIWQDNHLLILPSISEGTPLSLIEANICGRPAVVTDVGGNTEIIKENKNGWIAEAPLKKYIDSALERAWYNKDKWKEMGQIAHEKALKRYSVDAGQQLFDLIAKG